MTGDDASPVVRDGAAARRHLVDATMFWSPTSGGVRRYLLAKRAALGQHAQWRQSIVAPVDTGIEAAVVQAPPLPFSHGYRVPVARRRAADTLAALAPDVIEVGDPYVLAWAALDARERTGAKVVAFAHSNLPRLVRPFGRWAERAAQRYLHRLYGACDLVLAPSRCLAMELAALGLDNLAVQPLGVDVDTFHPARRSPIWRARLGIPPGHFAVVYAGRFGPEKHLDVLAAAVRRLRGVVLVVIGAGPRPPSGPNVIVRPFLADARDLAGAMASCDAFVHAGDQETFGLGVLEAMACGLPVIARNAHGLAELVEPATGRRVDADGPLVFAAAIDALADADDRLTLGRAARRRALQYAWPRVIALLLSRYDALVGRPGSRPSAPQPSRPVHRMP